MEFSIVFYPMILILFIMIMFKFRSFSDIFKAMFVSLTITGTIFFLLQFVVFGIEILIDEYTSFYFGDFRDSVENFIAIISFLPIFISLSASPFYLGEKELTLWEEFQLKYYKKIRGGEQHKDKDTVKEEIKEERKKFYINGNIF